MKIEESERLFNNIFKIGNRDKKVCFNEFANTKKYTGNYAYTNHNFVIQNNTGQIIKDDKWFPIICVVKNILLRGCPSKMSRFLQNKLGSFEKEREFAVPVPLISNEVPKWFNLIKGDDRNNNYPAKEFFETIIPEYLPEHTYIQQLMVPEVKIEDITLEYVDEFAEQQVDFYLPQAKLVIEIDGYHHECEINKCHDKAREKYLERKGVCTIRITTEELKNRNNIFINKINEIRARLELFKGSLAIYESTYNNFADINFSDKRLIATAILRFQILIISLLETGRLNLDDDEWNLNVIEHDVSRFEKIAINDLLNWTRRLAWLSGLEYHEPNVNFIYNGEINKEEYINIDFSLFKRWTDENELPDAQDIIFVRTDYFDEYNYFKVSIADKIVYQIKKDDSIKSVRDKEYLESLLDDIFGFSKGFKSGQYNAIIKALSGENTVGLLPTGGGKSLIYQFTSMMQPSLCFVVVPITSLMIDQRENLDNMGIENTNYINSMQEPGEKNEVLEDFSKYKYQFIWISPERFQAQEFRDRLDEINSDYSIGIAVIDEVHCLSEWGHSFRTSYLNLAKTIRYYCGKAQILALTATASENVLKDILVEFQMNRDNVSTVPSFTREELDFNIIIDEGSDRKLKRDNLERVILEIQDDETLKYGKNGQKAGIVFTRFANSRDGAYKLSSEVRNRIGRKLHYTENDIEWYTGTCPKSNNIEVMNSQEFIEYKKSVQKNFKESRFPLLFATKAFGMGIDKPDVRYTVHYGIPDSLEALYQEAGRAGRDGEKAKCYILLSREFFAEDKYGENFHSYIFGMNAMVKQIDSVLKEFKSKTKDILNNLFLWEKNEKDVNDEYRDVMKVFRYAERNAKIKIYGRQVGLKKLELEKTVYKLSLLGVIEDWTVERWGSENSVLNVYFADFDEKTVVNAVITYIRKYDVEFNPFKNELQDDNNKDYYDILKLERGTSYDRALLLLLRWQKNNITYSRRQAIYTVYGKCIEFCNNPDALKKYIEAYFRFDESTYAYEYLSDNPGAYNEWFEIFYEHNSFGDGRVLINEQTLEEKEASLRRFLESFRNNTALNYVSGLIKLFRNDYHNEDGEERFNMALKNIKRYEEKEKDYIFNQTYTLANKMEKTDKRKLAQSIITVFPERAMEVYDNLKDDYSYNFVLNNFNERIKKALGGLN